MRQWLRSNVAGVFGALEAPRIGGAVVVALALAVALAGCGGAGGGAGALGATSSPTATGAPTYGPGHYPPTSAITSATTLRTSDFPGNHVAAFSATATNAVTLQRFYAEMMALKPMPNGTYSCPVDFGIWYQTNFYSQGKLALQALIQRGGCGLVILGAHSARQYNAGVQHFDTRWAEVDDHFWPLLATAFDTTQSVLWATPDQNTIGPYAPTPGA
ncbi:MAG TPA: hypothetical protein VMV29_15000 [Ktedonobacterales bacterium]|nr:hypothetical protein [Ktedonobacterales bacterium]